MEHRDISILFVALHYKKEDEQELFKICKNGVSAAHYTLEENIILGLRQYAKVDLLTSLPIGSFPQMSNKLVIHSCQKIDRKEIGFINIPLIKDLIREYRAVAEIRRWAEDNVQSEKRVILIYDAIIPFIKAALKVKKKNRSIENVIIVPDLPGKYSVENRSYRAVISFLLKLKENAFYKKIGGLDAYILLTKYMAEVMGIGNKPRLIVECVTSSKEENLCEAIDKNSHVIMYAGELSSNVDLDILIEAFKYVETVGTELWICGTGALESYVQKQAQLDKRIKFLGFIPKNELERVQKNVAVFVNPRQNKHLYTRYSFPSKNAEYLKTGKPLVAYKLDCIPDEYDEYIFYPKSNSAQDMARAIDTALSLSTEQLIKLHEKQINFMIKNKSEMAQGRRIVTFLRGL